MAALVLATPAAAEQVAEIRTDWTGNDIVIEAITDPKTKGITCHITYFSGGMIDRLRQGNWFDAPSNSSIACRQTGPMVIDTIETDEDEKEIFSQRQSLIFKVLAVHRVYDRANDTLIYGCPTGRAAFAKLALAKAYWQFRVAPGRGEAGPGAMITAASGPRLLPSAPAAELHSQRSI
jgi:CreA protein